MEKKQKAIVYVVINDGEVVYASKDEDNADNYVEEKREEIREELIEELDIDEDEDPSKVEYQLEYASGAEYGIFKVVEIDLNKYKENETFEKFIQNLGNVCIEYNEIIDKLHENGEDEYDDDEEDEEED